MNLYIINEKNNAAEYGIGTYIRELTQALSHSSVNVCVIHLITDKPKVQIVKSDEISHYYFSTLAPKQQSNLSKLKELYYRNIVYLLRLHIEDKKNLIFHLNNNHSSKLAKELKKVFGCKIITTVHYLEWSLGLFGNRKRFRQILTGRENAQEDEYKKTVESSYHKEKEYFETVDHIISLSDNTMQILHDEYQINLSKITVIFNGLADSKRTSSKQKLRQKYHIPDIPIFLFAGRLDDIKGLTYALKAFKILLSKQSECHFIIAGDGNFSAYLKECEDIWMHITWTGLISKEKLYDLYQIADIGIMPSFHEQCSYVAIEMMMHGLPIIGNTSTGLKEMIIDGKTGLHIPVIEYEDRVDIDTSLLAEKMLYLMQNPKERKRLGANAHKRYEDVYASEVFRKNMIAFYSSLFTVDKNSILSNSSQTNI